MKFVLANGQVVGLHVLSESGISTLIVATARVCRFCICRLFEMVFLFLRSVLGLALLPIDNEGASR